MERLMHRARTLFRQNPLLAGVGVLVLLAVAGSLLVRLVFLLALLALPVVAGVMIGWHLRGNPGRLAPFFQWRDWLLDRLTVALEAVMRWVQSQLDAARANQSTPRHAVDPYRDEPRRHH